MNVILSASALYVILSAEGAKDLKHGILRRLMAAQNDVGVCKAIYDALR